MTAFHETAPQGPTAAVSAAIQAVVAAHSTLSLALRAARIEYFETFAAMVLGARGSFFGHCRTRDDAWAEFIRMTGTWLLRGYGAWTVTDTHTGAVLGFVQIGAEPGDRESELGDLVSENAQGQGIARETAEAVRLQALDAFAFPSLVSHVNPGSARSIALAERPGATQDPSAEAELPDDDRTLVFRHALKRTPA